MTSYESGQQSLCMRAMVELQQTAFTAKHISPGLSVSESGSLR